MTNTVLLRDAIQRSGLKMKYIAAKMNLSYYTFQLKTSGNREFKGGEIKQLTKILNLTMDEQHDIFLADKGDC